MGRKMCRSFGRWWVAYSWWWCRMVNLPGMAADLGVALTLVLSLGRGVRRKALYWLVVGSWEGDT